jgi:integrase
VTFPVGLAQGRASGASPELLAILETLVPKRDRDRLYWRTRGGVARAYADFRDYADVGGGREALIPDGYSSATSDPDVALALLAKRLKELDSKRRGLILHGEQRQTTLYEIAALDLRIKVENGDLRPGYAEIREKQLRRVFSILGGERDPECRQLNPNGVTVADVRRVISVLRQVENGRGGRYSEQTVLHHLNALSSAFRRAASEGFVAPGFNPVGALQEKPAPGQDEARWLEVHEAALLLESARTYIPRKDWCPFPYALVAAWLLTGCRETELYGLELDDVSFERRTITIRPNRWRQLKTRRSERVIPLWPQLEGILRDHFRNLERWRLERLDDDHMRIPDCDLVFPTWTTRWLPGIMTDARKLLDRISGRAGWKQGEIRSKMFRHTYCAARLQTLDGGAPVAHLTVARELGHSSPDMVEEVYSHLGTVRHRSEAVEYRIEQHRQRLADRLSALQVAERAR